MSTIFIQPDHRIILKNKRLEISILKPGKAYMNPRFDWNGFIAEVCLDGSHHFSAPHMDETGTIVLGQGLCNEFSMNKPIGLEASKISGHYPKIGIGLLADGTEPKSPRVPASDILPYETRIFEDKSSITFQSMAKDCNGYAFDYKKSIQLKDNWIIVDYTLRNAGTQPVTTDEYCHNFVLVDDHKIGSDYLLRHPYNLKQVVDSTNDLTESLSISDDGLTWRYQPDKVYYLRTDLSGNGSHGWWELIHKPSGIGMREEVDFTPDVFALWGESHVVSPELFVPIRLQPGETQTWQRRFQFFTDHE